MRYPFPVALLCLLQMSRAFAQPAQVPQPNCGITSVLALAKMTDQTVSTPTQNRLLKDYPQPTVAMADVKKIAASLNMNLIGVKATLDELVASQRPVILHLQNPDHFALMLDGSKESIRLLESPESNIEVLPRAEIERRFDGYALLPQVAEDKEAPQVRFDDTDYLFGVSGVGQKVEHLYAFTNTGKKELKVAMAGSSCGCTGGFLAEVGNYMDVTLKPGQASKVRITHTVQTPGAIEQMVTLKTNDPARPVVYLTIRGSAPQDLQVSAQSLMFNTEKGRALQKTLRIVGPPLMNVTEVKTGSDFLDATCELKETTELKKVWQVLVVQKAGAPVGESKTTLMLKTTHPERPNVIIPIASSVRGDLEVTPRNAFFGFVQLRDDKSLQLLIRSRSGALFKIGALKLLGEDTKTLKVQNLDASNVAQHRILLHLASMQPQYIDARLQVTTDVAGENTLTIPITALIDKP